MKEPGTAVVSVQERIAMQLAKQAEAAKSMRTTGSYISFKNAVLKVDGVAVPNNTADVRVLACIGERAYYEGAFDADVAQVPICYALDSDVPHSESKTPQSADCASCEHNKWGSALRGRGKACREGARLIVAPANVPLKTAPFYTAKVPVTSLAAVQNFTSRCQMSQKMSGEFITVLSVVEDKKSFFKVKLDIKEASSDLDMEQLLLTQDAAYELAMTPYPNLDS